MKLYLCSLYAEMRSGMGNSVAVSAIVASNQDEATGKAVVLCKEVFPLQEYRSHNVSANENTVAVKALLKQCG